MRPDVTHSPKAPAARGAARGWILLAALAIAAAVLSAAAHANGARRLLKVCADPNNLPFSNERGDGFENRLAELVARDLGAEVRYTWWAQRRGFVRNTLQAGACDVIMGIPTGFELARATRPYYRAGYAFVFRQASDLDLRSIDDPRLRSLRIGVHVIGEDYADVPPARALARRGMIENMVGYSIFGNYAEPDPPARLIEAVADGEIDVAIAWGPLAGYSARRQAVPLTVVPVSPGIDDQPFVFYIAMGVRRRDAALAAQLDAVLERRAADIEALLREYGITNP